MVVKYGPENTANLNEAAQRAHAAGDISETTRLLDEIDAEEERAEQRLHECHHVLVDDVHSLRQRRIAIKDAQIPLALAGLRYADAARLIAERIDFLEDDAGKRFGLLWGQCREFYVKGREKGLNADLLVSVEIARLAIDRAPGYYERWLAFKALGNALWVLGERETGMARCKETDDAFRAADDAFRAAADAFYDPRP